MPIPGTEDDRSVVTWIEQTDTGIKAGAITFLGRILGNAYHAGDPVRYADAAARGCDAR